MTRESQPLPIHVTIPSTQSTHNKIFNTISTITLQDDKDIIQYFLHHSTKHYERGSYAKISKNTTIQYNQKSHKTIISLHYSVYNRFDVLQWPIY